MSLLHYSKLEPSLADLLVAEYDGPRDADGCFEGEASATFKSGQTYVGSFKGGMMHGRGKYSWNDGTVYTGEFIRNVITGVGKYEWPNGTTYEGTVLNGLKHGNGTFTGQHEGAHCRYEGEWDNGKRHGVGTMSYNANRTCVYRGEWVCNKRHGEGEMQYESGNTYSGTWVDDVKCGFGKMVWVDRGENYVGEWRADKQNGFGTHVWAAQGTISSRWIGTQRQMYNRYRGEWHDGLRHGTGTFFYANGARYSGMWVQGMKQGDGVFIHENGALYAGSFVKDRMIKSSRTSQRETDDIQLKPQVHLYLGDLLPVDESLAAVQLNDLQKALLRVNSELKSIYQAYTASGARCGNSSSVDLGDGIFTMSSKLFWAFCQDIKVVPNVLSIAAINALLLAMRRQHCAVVEAARIRNSGNMNCIEKEAGNNTRPLPKTYVDEDVDDVLTARALGTQSAVRPLLFREFVEAVVRIAVVISPISTVSISSAFKEFANNYISLHAMHRPMTSQRSESCESAGNESAEVVSNVHSETFDSIWTAAGEHASVIDFREVVAKECCSLASSFGTLSLRPVVLLTIKLFSQESRPAIYNSVARAYQQQRGRCDEEAANLLFLSSLEIEMFELAELLARVAFLCTEKPLSGNAVDEVISELMPKMRECAAAAAIELS